MAYVCCYSSKYEFMTNISHASSHLFCSIYWLLLLLYHLPFTQLKQFSSTYAWIYASPKEVVPWRVMTIKLAEVSLKREAR